MLILSGTSLSLAGEQTNSFSGEKGVEDLSISSICFEGDVLVVSNAKNNSNDCTPYTMQLFWGGWKALEVWK